jgi:hypothetical protein
MKRVSSHEVVSYYLVDNRRFVLECCETRKSTPDRPTGSSVFADKIMNATYLR